MKGNDALKERECQISKPKVQTKSQVRMENEEMIGTEIPLPPRKRGR